MPVKQFCAPFVFLLLLAAVPMPAKRILLITIDTLRADHLVCYGYPKPTSPNIDALASQSIQFRNAFAAAPLTLPSHATMLSGLYPAHHGYRDNAFFEAGNAPLVSETLKKNGFATAAFVSGAPLSAAFGLNRGFDVYDDGFEGERLAADTTDHAVKWVTGREGSFFVWVHYFDPHAEYNPPSGFRNFENPYDGEIAYVDSQIPRLLSAVGKDAIVILTADHGESLGEHGESTHGIFLYDATLRVPLLLRAPGLAPAIRNTSVTLCDLAATILELAGAAPMRTDGVSLVHSTQERMLFAESQYAARNFGYAPLFASMRDQRKFILAPQPEFYNLADDPNENRNILKQSKADAWRQAARGYAAETKPAVPQAIPEEEAEKLRSLGYVSASLPAGNVDPKERMRDIENFNEAMRLLSRGEFAQAESAFRKITTQDANSALGFRFLGDALSAQGKYSDAAKAYSASVTLRPDAEAAVRLAKSQFQSGDKSQAENTLKNIVRDFPGYDSAAFELASLYAAQQKFDAALDLLKGSSAGMHNQRGILYLVMKEFAEAEEEFRAALSIQTKPEYWNNLGLVLQRQEHPQEAEGAYRQALELNPAYQECEVNLAFLLVAQQNWDLALAHLVHLTDGNPKLWNARMARAYALENLGRTEEALQQYQSLLNDAPEGWPQRAQIQSRINKLKK